MNNKTFAPLLRLSAILMLVGQLLYVVITLFHAGGDDDDHPTQFAGYAASAIWTAVHVSQFVCMTALLAGLIALFYAVDMQTGIARLASRFGATAAAAAWVLYAGVLAVDGVALKHAVDAWAVAPDGEKAARFASAEAVRWLEYGMRSYQNFALGLALLLCAVTVVRMARFPRAIAFLMGLSGLTYLVQGWVDGSAGFTPMVTNAIMLSEILNAVWMIWLVVVAVRMRGAAPRRLADDGMGRPDAISMASR